MAKSKDKIAQDTKFLSEFILEARRNRVEEVLAWRTRHITVVLEDIYQSQNASAVLRTSDSCGIQDVHIVENRNEYQLNPDVTQGADKWLTLNKFRVKGIDNSIACLDHLKGKGYSVVATTLDDFTHTPEIIPLDKPLAIAFGNEKEGLSQTVLRHADYRMKIPMFGFSQSFNISVSAAITLYTLMGRLHKSKIAWPLAEEDKKTLRLEWYQKITGIGIDRLNKARSIN